LSRDPIEEAGGKGLYAYVLNHPTCAIDPVGLELGGGTRDGGSQVWTKDVNFQGEKIGSAQVWIHAVVRHTAYTLSDAVWIQFDRDPERQLTCKWAQFVLNKVFDEGGTEQSQWFNVNMLKQGKYGERMLDIAPYSGWMYQFATSSGNTEAIYDQPSGNTTDYYKAVGEFESLLLCRPSACDDSVKWKPAFQVSWKLTETKKDNSKLYEVTAGNSIASLPSWANTPLWLVGYRVLGARTPVFTANPTQ
jgi:hypothetical protein